MGVVESIVYSIVLRDDGIGDSFNNAPQGEKRKNSGVIFI